MSKLVMKIRPSVLGFYVKHYYTTTIIALIAVIGGIYALVLANSFEFALVGFAIGVFLIILGVVHAIMNKKTTVLFISKEEIVYEHGIIEHHKRVAPVHMITDSFVHRSLLDKILKTADLRINTSGTSTYEIDIEDYDHKDIEMIHKMIYNLIRKTPTSMNDKDSVNKEKK